MREHLILRLKGPMQAWGDHTFEGRRPAVEIPTRSGVVGLLAACLGIGRDDRQGLDDLNRSIGMAVLVEKVAVDGGKGNHDILSVKVTDYHTVLDARKEYAGLKSLPNSIQTWREYVCDASFLVAIWTLEGGDVTLENLTDAVQRPCYTPYLGRRSCPISVPLYQGVVSARTGRDALQMAGDGGMIYSEELGEKARGMTLRDQPVAGFQRRFNNRTIYVYGG